MIAALVLSALAIQTDPGGAVGPQLTLSANGPTPYHHGNDTAYCPATDRYVSVFLETLDTNQQYLRAVTTDAITGEVSAKIDINVNQDWIDSPSISWNPAAGRFLVAYSRYDATFDGPFIYGCLLNPDGTPQAAGAGFPISGAPGSGLYGDLPRVACDGSDWMVVWTAYTAIEEVTGRVVDVTSTNAAPVFGGASFLIRGSPNTAGFPTIAFGAGADYLVLWRNEANYAYITGRTVSKDGATLGTVTDYDIGFGFGWTVGSPALVANTTASEFVMAWPRYINASVIGQVWSRRIGPGGAILGAPVQLDSTSKSIADSVTIAWSSSANRYIAAWFQDDTPADGIGLYDVRAAVLSGVTAAPLVQDLVFSTYGSSVGSGLSIALATRPLDSQVLVQWKKEPYGGGVNPLIGQRYLVGASQGTPADPILLAQHRLDGAGAIPSGGTTSLAGFLAKAWLEHPGAQLVLLQVEARPVNTAFSGVGTAKGALSAPHALFSTSVTPLALDASFHWQVRSIDIHGVASTWVSLGAQPDIPSEIDLKTRTAQSLPVQGSEAQIQDAGGKPIPLGQPSTEGKIRFQATVSDADGDAVQLEVEVRALGVDFTGTPNVIGATGPPGMISAVTTLTAGSYHWQARTRDALLDASAWTPYGGNNEFSPDLQLVAIGSQGGGKKCGNAADGLPGASILGLAALPLLLRRRTNS